MKDPEIVLVLGPDNKTMIKQPTNSAYAKNGGPFKGNIVIPPAWYNEEINCWLEWIPWDEAI